jgi:DNA-directed RNA polymerase subunit RPC12/RpoP
MATDYDKTAIFDIKKLNEMRCPDCGGSGQLHFESENINENFEVEKQTVITACPRCDGKGFLAPG